MLERDLQLWKMQNEIKLTQGNTAQLAVIAFAAHLLADFL